MQYFSNKQKWLRWDLCMNKDDLEHITLTPVSSPPPVIPIFSGPYTQALPDAFSYSKLISNKWVLVTLPGPTPESQA